MPKSSQATSIAIHGLLIILLLAVGMHPAVIREAQKAATIVDPPRLPRGAAGGGGNHEREPARKGMLPTRSTRVFTPPLVQMVQQPKLPVQPTIDAPPEVLAAPNPILGDPNGVGMLSGGTGGPLGIGDGRGRSIGSGIGDRWGDGVDGVFSSGHGVTMPVALHTAEPEYSEPARRARLSGTILVYAEIGPDGKPRNLRVTRGLGLGLDEKALEAVSAWRFRPGTKDGRPVTVRATFEVNFRLL